MKKILNQTFQAFIFSFESLFFISNRISTEDYFQQKKKSNLFFFLINIIPSPSPSLYSTVQICFSSKEFSSEKKTKKISIVHQNLFCDIFSLNTLKKQFLSNVFFLIDQKQKFVHKEKFNNLLNNSRKNPVSNQINSTKFQREFSKCFSILQNLIKCKYFHQIYQKKQFSFEIILQNQKIFFFSFTNLFKIFSLYSL